MRTDPWHRSRTPTPAGTFIGKWISVLKPAWGEIAQKGGRLDDAERQQALENLRTFPLVKEQMAQGKMRLHGGFFDIATGQLPAYDPATRHFAPVT